MSSKNIWSGLFVMVGLLAVAVSIPAAVRTARGFDRIVTVKGLCEKEVMANQVIWPVVYKVGGNALEDVYRNVTLKNKIIIDWLTKSGISESEINIAAPKIEDTRTNQYGDNRAYNYIVTSIITVCTDKVDLVRSLQSEQFSLLDRDIAIGTGNQWEYPIQYDYTGLNEIKPQMIEEATHNARKAAEKFAADSDSRLGKIRSASQGQFSVTDRDSNTPYIKVVRVVTTVNYMLKD